MFRQKLQIRFAKRGDLRFISHHDLMRLFERASRRAGLPVRMSEGFNPRPRISFPLSLAVGVEGREEVVEVQFSDWVAPAELHRRLQAALPHAVELTQVTTADPRRTGRVVSVTYRIEHPAIGQLTEGHLEALLARREVAVMRARRGRSMVVDIRPYLQALTLEARGTARPALRAELRVTPRGTARPEEVWAALGLPSPGEAPPADAQEAAAPHIVRERVRLAVEPNEVISPQRSAPGRTDRRPDSSG